jgi:hypothetical protein
MKPDAKFTFFQTIFVTKKRPVFGRFFAIGANLTQFGPKRAQTRRFPVQREDEKEYRIRYLSVPLR